MRPLRYLPFKKQVDPAYFTASLKPLPAVNFRTFEALIVIVSPVRGFLPLQYKNRYAENRDSYVF